MGQWPKPKAKVTEAPVEVPSEARLTGGARTGPSEKTKARKAPLFVLDLQTLAAAIAESPEAVKHIANREARYLIAWDVVFLQERLQVMRELQNTKGGLTSDEARALPTLIGHKRKYLQDLGLMAKPAKDENDDVLQLLGKSSVDDEGGEDA